MMVQNTGDEQPNKRISVTISEDNMSAYLRLAVPMHGENDYSYEDVKAALEDSGVKMGIDESQIQNILQHKIYNANELIASGKSAEDGVDGEYELFFNLDDIGKPLERADGSVDYYNMKMFELVSAGDKLAQYTPPTKGVFGYDVKGKLLIPKAGRPKSPLRGKGFTVSEDGNTYYAAYDGKVEYRNFDLNVYSVLTIPGNVDISVGNIDFNGDVDIRGNVISGITISAKGNISIGGHVEAAVIRAGGNVIFKDGVNGKGLARVEAGGNISARFLENVTVQCLGDVYANYMLNCNIVANGKVIVKGNQSSIQGGDVMGMLGVEVGNAGVETGVATVIRVGATKAVRQQYADLVNKIRDFDTEIDMLDTLLDKYLALKEKQPEKFQQEMYNKVFQSKIIKNSEKNKLNEDAMKLCDLIYASENANIKVMKNLYPGVKIIVNGNTYTPNTQLVSMVIRNIGGKISIRGIMDLDVNQ